MDIQELSLECKMLRRDIINMVTDASSGHIGGSLSAVELMATTFYTQMRIESSCH